MTISPLKRFLLPLLALLAGCSTANQPRIVSIPSTTPGYHGTVHGGQQPITGATIQIYAVGTTGDGSAAHAVLTSPLVTDANGFFDLTNKITCPTAQSLLYLVATGGNPGLPAPAPAGTQISLITALGQCNNPSNIQFINVNEVTTVAAIYALAPFMVDLTHIGSSASDAQGLSGAFNLAWQFADITNGQSPGNSVIPSDAAGIPTAQINTLANLLAVCVNSSGGTAGDTSICGRLFTFLTPSGSAAPTDTTMALLNLVLNPGLNTAGLFQLTPATGPFQPTLTRQPADFRVTPSYNPFQVQFNPGFIDFGGIVTTVHSSSEFIFISPQSSGMRLWSIDLVGPNKSDFVLTGPPDTDCQDNYGLSYNCQMLATFTPSGTGLRRAYVVITFGYPDGYGGIKTFILPLTGTGIGAINTTGPLSISASNVSFSLYNTPYQVTITNPSASDINITDISIAGGGIYTQTNNCGRILAAHAACVVSVFLHPANPTNNGVLSITSGSSSTTQTVTLTSLVDPTVFTPPDLLDLGTRTVGTTGSVMFTWSARTTSHEELSISGPNASDFSFEPASLQSVGYCDAPNIGACGFSVYFTPSGPGTRTASISFSGTANGQIPLTGIGVAP